MRYSCQEEKMGESPHRTAGRRTREVEAISNVSLGLGQASGSPPALYPIEHEHSRIYSYIPPPSLPLSLPRLPRSFLLCERETSSIFESFSEIAIVFFVSAGCARERGREEEEAEKNERGGSFSISSLFASLLPPSHRQSHSLCASDEADVVLADAQ